MTPAGILIRCPVDGCGAAREPAQASQTDAKPRATVEPARKASATTTGPINVVREARKRLREIHREIKRLRKLETERDELMRLLDAAQPKAQLRALPRRSAG